MDGYLRFKKIPLDAGKIQKHPSTALASVFTRLTVVTRYLVHCTAAPSNMEPVSHLWSWGAGNVAPPSGDVLQI